MAPRLEKAKQTIDVEPAPKLRWVGLLLAGGIAYWYFSPLGKDPARLPPLILLAAAVAVAVTIAAAPSARGLVDRLLARLRRPSPASATRAAVAIGVAAGLYLVATNWRQATHLIPRLSDESSYLIQARMLAEGYLWHSPHPPEIRPFFDTLNVLIEPAYGSMYFPGTAMFYVPAVWLGLPYWNISLLLSAACIGLFYRLIVDLIDGVYALAAALMLLGLTMFRALSVMLLSQTPMLMMGLIMLLAYMRWRRRFDWRWAALIGVLAGWSGITRPADALCYSIAIGVAMLLDLRRPPAPAADADAPPAPADRPPAGRRTWCVTISCLVLPALPFLSLQAVQNAGMTGHWWEFPEARYADETYPAPMLGFHDYDPATWKRPASERKRLLSEAFARGEYARHRPENIPGIWWHARLPETFAHGLPNPLLVMLLPAGLLGLRTRPRAVVAATLASFLSFYAFYVFYIPHYMVVIAPPLALLVLLGARAVERSIGGDWPRARAAVALGLPLSIGAMSVGALPEFHPDLRDHAIFPGAEPVFVEYLLEDLETRLGERRAIVLFRFDLRTHVLAGESLYTDDVAWPDDSQIVRAADLGPKNVELFRYYANTANQPDRIVYLYDASTGKLSEPWGTVKELANQETHKWQPL